MLFVRFLYLDFPSRYTACRENRTTEQSVPVLLNVKVVGHPQPRIVAFDG
jgi:hypothetical protein